MLDYYNPMCAEDCMKTKKSSCHCCLLLCFVVDSPISRDRVPEFSRSYGRPAHCIRCRRVCTMPARDKRQHCAPAKVQLVLTWAELSFWIVASLMRWVELSWENQNVSNAQLGRTKLWVINRWVTKLWTCHLALHSLACADCGTCRNAPGTATCNLVCVFHYAPISKSVQKFQSFVQRTD